MNNKPTMLERFSKYSIVASYAFGIVFLFLDIFIAATSLIMGTVSTNPHVKYYLYVLLGLAGINLVLYATLTALYFVGDMEDRLSRHRIKATRNIRIFTRVVNILYSADLLILSYVEKGLSVGNENWDSFLLLMSYIYIVIFIVLLIYGLWKNAWINENPERFTYYGEITPYKDDYGQTTDYRKYPQHKQDSNHHDNDEYIDISEYQDKKQLKDEPKKLADEPKKIAYKEKGEKNDKKNSLFKRRKDK